VGCAVADIGTEPALHHLKFLATLGMRAEHGNRLARSAPRFPTVSRLRQLDHRGVHTGVEHFGGRAQPGIFAVMLEIGTVAPDRGNDRIAGLGVRADVAGQ
jgi:hypothetical protein